MHLSNNFEEVLPKWLFTHLLERGMSKYHLLSKLEIMIGIRLQVEFVIRLKVGLLLLSNFKRMLMTFSCTVSVFNIENFWIRYLELNKYLP